MKFLKHTKVRSIIKRVLYLLKWLLLQIDKLLNKNCLIKRIQGPGRLHFVNVIIVQKAFFIFLHFYFGEAFLQVLHVRLIRQILTALTSDFWHGPHPQRRRPHQTKCWPLDTIAISAEELPAWKLSLITYAHDSFILYLFHYAINLEYQSKNLQEGRRRIGEWGLREFWQRTDTLYLRCSGWSLAGTPLWAFSTRSTRPPLVGWKQGAPPI